MPLKRTSANRYGVEHPKAKLTNDDVRNMRYLYWVERPQLLRDRDTLRAKRDELSREIAALNRQLAALSAEGLGEKFAINTNTAHKVVTYRTWQHVADFPETNEAREKEMRK